MTEEIESKCKVVQGNNDTVQMYDESLDFLQSMIDEYANNEERENKYSPVEVVSGVTHCMIKIMFSLVGHEHTLKWLDQVKAMQQGEHLTSSLQNVIDPNNSIH